MYTRTMRVHQTEEYGGTKKTNRGDQWLVINDLEDGGIKIENGLKKERTVNAPSMLLFVKICVYLARRAETE